MNSENSKWNFAATALILSICGLLALPVLSLLFVVLSMTLKIRTGVYVEYAVLISGPLLGFIAVVLAHIARRQLRDRSSWREMAKATAGMIIGYATLVYLATGWIAGLLFSHGMKDF